MHLTCINKGEGFEALLCIVRFFKGYCRRGGIAWVVSSGLFVDVGVGGDGGLLECECRGFRVNLGCLGDGYGSDGCGVEGICGLCWVPGFALEYVELVEVRSLRKVLRGFRRMWVGRVVSGGCMLSLEREWVLHVLWEWDRCVGWYRCVYGLFLYGSELRSGVWSGKESGYG